MRRTMNVTNEAISQLNAILDRAAEGWEADEHSDGVALASEMLRRFEEAGLSCHRNWEEGAEADTEWEII